jgi:ComF family protein
MLRDGARGLRGTGQRIARVAIDVVFPPRCAGCGHRGTWVCDRCKGDVLLFERPWCPRCGSPKDAPCICAELSPALDLVRSAAWYHGWLRTAITSFKYEGESARAAHLANLADSLMPEFGADNVLVPVPLHPSRKRRRGYNQAERLAIEIGRSTGIAIEQVLRRTVPTTRQVGLTADQRGINVRGAFAVVAGTDVAGLRFVLIDDVFTTGATLGACAATLKSGGASWVGALTIARER